VLTWVRASGVEVRGMSLLGGARLRVGRSAVDPLCHLLGPEPRISPGIGADFSFTIGPGEPLAAPARSSCA
jgi:hypothetical protein